jgi:hypothetical protein
MQAKVALGPMSTHAVEVVYEYSDSANTPLMLIPSKNQVDRKGGGTLTIGQREVSLTSAARSS